MLRRLAHGVGANVLDKLVIAGTQLLLVPALATQWGLQTYGMWVLIATVPSFLGISDFGFATAAGTKMTMAVARGERDTALVIFQSAWSLILLSGAAILALAIGVAALIPSTMLPDTPDFDADAVRLTLILLIAYGITALQGSIFIAAFRSAGQFALGTLSVTMVALAENVALIAAVFAGAGPVEAALVFFLFRLGGLCVQAWLLRRSVPWHSLGFTQSNRSEIRELVRPAMAVMMLPLGQAAFLQGTAIALGVAASEAAVPAFTATRTLSRIGLQLTSLLNAAIMPEFSAASAHGDRPRQAMIVIATLLASALIAIPFALALALFGTEIVALWTNDMIHAPRLLMLAMAATVLFGSFWHPLSNLVLAMNRHAGYAYPFVVLALASVPLAYLLSLRFGAAGAGIAIALLDIGMSIVMIRLGRTLFVSRTELRAACAIMLTEARRLLRRGRRPA